MTEVSSEIISDDTGILHVIRTGTKNAYLATDQAKAKALTRHEEIKPCTVFLCDEFQWIQDNDNAILI